MILAKSLRVGNKFYSPHGGIQTVFDISDNTARNTLEYASNNHKLMYSHLITVEENKNQYKPCEMEPIPLNEEILLKIGFTKNSLWLTLDKPDVNIYYVRDKIWLDENEVPHIKYIHQVQNLYFALTGNELTLK